MTMTKMELGSATARLALLSYMGLLGAVLLGGCSSSFGSGDGSAPARTYVVGAGRPPPPGGAPPPPPPAPVRTTAQPPSD